MATKDIVSSFADGSVTASDDGGHSATLAKFSGDMTISGMVPQGRTNDVTQVQGAVVGVRKGERVFGTVSFTGVLSDFDDAFHKLVMGVTAGYVSTTADIGDGDTFDLSFDASYSTDVRTFLGDDLNLTEWSMTQGSPSSTVSFSAEILGPIVIDGTTYVPSR